MSLDGLFHKYFLEEYGRETISNEHGFICYFLNPACDECLVTDFFIKEDSRKSMEAKKLFSQVRDLAKEKGYRYITGIVAVSPERSEKATKIMRCYFALGFKMYDTINGHVCFRLDINKE